MKSGTHTAQAEINQPAIIIIRPNRSLSPRAAKLVFASMAVLQCLIAAGFWLVAGFWMVLPFAGLELAVFGAALAWAMYENRYREVVTFDGDSVTVEKGFGKPEQRWQANSLWTRVEMRAVDGLAGRQSRRLLLRSGGKECELGRCLVENEKSKLADRLRAAFGKPAII